MSQELVGSRVGRWMVTDYGTSEILGEYVYLADAKAKQAWRCPMAVWDELDAYYNQGTEAA